MPFGRWLEPPRTRGDRRRDRQRRRAIHPERGWAPYVDGPRTRPGSGVPGRLQRRARREVRQEVRGQLTPLRRVCEREDERMLLTKRKDERGWRVCVDGAPTDLFIHTGLPPKYRNPQMWDVYDG